LAAFLRPAPRLVFGQGLCVAQDVPNSWAQVVLSP
jgi:hypothetical protein